MLMVIACKESPVEQWIIRAEENMEVNADSAYRCLHHAMKANGWNDELRARYALRYTQAMHKCRIPLEGDSLINTAVAYYTKSHDRHRLALSLLYKGLVHKQRKEVVKATEAFALSEQWFEGVEDDQYKALLYNHYGALMMKEENFDNALTYFKKSYELELKGDSLHYIVNTCDVIATIFKLYDKPDSAKSYYEKGLQYEGKVSLQQYSQFKKNYANFLRENGEYEKAEKMLHECEPYITDKGRYSLYSSLATLYYETKDYVNALAYAEKMKESTDSLMLRTCFLHLYRIFKRKGQIDSAVYYHDLYRIYDSDIAMRMKTAEVAAIPHRVKSEILKEQTHTLTGWRTWLLVTIAGVISVAWWMLKRTRYRHRCEQQIKNDELNMVGKKLGETSVELGRLKGAMTNHVDAMNRMKEEHRRVLDKQKDVLY